MKMVLKVKKEASDFPKAKVKAKALKVKKVVLESVHSQKKKKSAHHLHSSGTRHCMSKGSPNTPERAPPGETSWTTMPPTSF